MNQKTNWCQNAKRIGKLFMVENDPGTYDLDFWADYFRKTKVDTINICAGGIMAFYPTRIPYHRKSRWMSDTDPFGELVGTAREMGLNVIARVDPHATHQETMEAHPEWIVRDATGNPVRHPSNPELWLTCTKGPYYFTFMADVVREISQMYRVEGFHVNRWEGCGMCYCQSCRDEFRAFSGLELPREENPKDKAWVMYDQWLGKKHLQVWDTLNDVAQSVNPDAYFLPNLFRSKVIGAKDIQKRMRIINVDYQSRGPRTPIWDIGVEAKKVRGLVGEEVPVVMGNSPGYENIYRWKDSVRDSADHRLWYLEAIANGLDIAWGKFSAVLYDWRWLEPTQKLFQWHAEHEHYLKNKRSAATAVIIYPVEKNINPVDGTEKESSEHVLGAYLALMEGRIPFDMLHSDLIDTTGLSRYKVVILPNICRLSDEQAEHLQAYVETGGRIVATYETSLYNEDGSIREDFALGNLFGTRFQKRRAPYPIMNAYLKINATADGRSHPILAGLENTGRIIHSGRQLDVEPLAPTENPPLTSIPAYPDLPMEDVFPRQTETNIAGVYIRELGQGRVVYYPWDLDRVYWEVQSADHGDIIRNTVRWLLDGDVPAEVNGPGLLDVTCRIQETAMVVHMVNLNNPNAMTGTIHAFTPIGRQTVTVRIPAGKQTMEVKMLVGSGTAAFVQSGNLVKFTVESIVDHEVAAIDFH